MDNHIVKSLTTCKFVCINNIVTHDSSAFTHSRSCSASNDLHVFIARKIFAQEFCQKSYLLSEFKVSREYLFNPGDINLIYLCSIHLTASFLNTRMKAHSCKLFRNLASSSLLLAPIKESLAIELNLIHITYAYDTLFLIDSVYRKLQCNRLHKTVFPALSDFCTSHKCNKAVTCTVNCNWSLKS